MSPMRLSLGQSVAATTCALLLLLHTGCTKSDAPAGSLEAPTAKASSEKTSFKEVTSRLDAGGSLYLYLGTEQWLQGLSTNVAEWREVVSGLPGLMREQQANVARLFDLLTTLAQKSGIEEISGVGVSAVQQAPGLYHSKLLVHHYPGRQSGFLWSLFGKTPHSLDGLDYLPATTAWASFSDLDLPLLWTFLEQELTQLGIPGLSDAVTQFPTAFSQNAGIKWGDALASLAGTCGIAFTLDESRKISLPLPNQTLEFPEPGLVIALKVKNDLIYNRVTELVKANPQVEQVETNDTKMITMPIPLPLPISLRPTLARAGDYLFLASSDSLIDQLLAAKRGKGAGLRGTEEFKKLSQNIPTQGNAFNFISAKLGAAIAEVMQTALTARGGLDGARLDALQKLIRPGQGAFAFSVAANTQDGWFIVGNGNQHPAKALMAPTAIAPAAVVAGMVLPALAKAKARAQSIACMNNLKQIGLAGRMWATEHNDVLPKTFLEMKSSLGSPRVLLCPGDSRRQLPPNASWADFEESMTSYEMVSPGAKGSETSAVFVRCPIHGTTCLVDGSVQQLPGGR